MGIRKLKSEYTFPLEIVFKNMAMVEWYPRSDVT